MFPNPALKLLAAAGLAALAVSACGRRGAMEPPQAAAPGRPVQAAASGDGDELAQAAVPPAGTGAPVQTGRGAKRGYRIPKDPFILDPLL